MNTLGIFSQFPEHFENEKKNDSTFSLINSYSNETSFILIPLYHSNVAKYISGINNNNNIIKPNKQSLKIVINDQFHILLIAIKKINKGDVLYYDYNESMENITYNTSFFKKI